MNYWKAPGIICKQILLPSMWCSSFKGCAFPLPPVEFPALTWWSKWSLQKFTVQLPGCCLFHTVLHLILIQCGRCKGTTVPQGWERMEWGAGLQPNSCPSHTWTGELAAAPAFVFLQELHRRSEQINFFWPMWQEGGNSVASRSSGAAINPDSPHLSRGLLRSWLFDNFWEILLSPLSQHSASPLNQIHTLLCAQKLSQFVQNEGMGIVLSILLWNMLLCTLCPHRRKWVQLAAQTHSFQLT